MPCNFDRLGPDCKRNYSKFLTLAALKGTDLGWLAFNRNFVILFYIILI